MNIETNLTLGDKATMMLNLCHDEFQECVLLGYEENYQEWAEFAAWCIAKIVIPNQPEGTPLERPRKHPVE